MNQSVYREPARLFHLLSHPARLHILDELRREDAYVCHLQAVMGRSQAYISQQLRVLREAGAVTDCKDGTNVCYRLTDRRVEWLLEKVIGPARETARLPTCSCPRCQGECRGERWQGAVPMGGQAA